MTQIQASIKLQYVPLSEKVDWDPLFKAYKRGTHRQIKKVCKCLQTPDGETYYEVEVEGHEIDSYYVKIVKSKFGCRGSCHCHDFRHRKLPQFQNNGIGSWCKHLLVSFIAIRDLEEELKSSN